MPQLYIHYLIFAYKRLTLLHSPSRLENNSDHLRKCCFVLDPGRDLLRIPAFQRHAFPGFVQDHCSGRYVVTVFAFAQGVDPLAAVTGVLYYLSVSHRAE